MRSSSSARTPASGPSSSPAPADQVLARRELARRRFGAFFEYVWRLPLARHQAVLAEALERVEATPGARLIVTMPPGHAKSETTSVAFTAWCLGRGYSGRGPLRQVAIGSYGYALSRSFSAAVRNLFEDPQGRCRRVFPEAALASRSEGEWHLAGAPANHPSCVAVGVGGGFTGRRADLAIIDDPFKNDEDAQSEAYREKVWRWWTKTVRTRLRGAGRVIVIQTRWHEDDLAGRLLAGGDGTRWRLLHFPAIDAEGRALWPEQYPLEVLAEARAEIGERGWNALYQGNPTPEAGLVWRRDWFDQARYRPGECPPPERCVEVVTAWDPADGLDEANCYTAGVRVGRDARGHFWVYNVGRGHWTMEEIIRHVRHGFGGGPNEVAVVEADSRGRWLLQALDGCGRSVLPIEAIADKVTRGKVVSHLAETGRVHVCTDAEGEGLIAELCAFPNGRSKDVPDAFHHALRRLNDTIGAPEFFSLRLG